MLAWFALNVDACTSGLTPPCDGQLETFWSVGKPRGVGDELTGWIMRIEGDGVMRQVRFGVQVLRTGHPKIDMANPNVSEEDMIRATPYFQALGQGLQSGVDRLRHGDGSPFRLDQDPQSVLLTPQGPLGGQAGWRAEFTLRNPRLV